ncbi:MAG: hypothetical protein OXN90_02750 [Gemmatimonadota bacterium]|nr:hypothetical protein [Gemmatimonadota bacterium]
MPNPSDEAIRTVDSALNAALNSSTFKSEIGNIKVPLAEIKNWETSLGFGKMWVRPTVPERQLSALVDALRPHLEQFTNKKTGLIGFAPCDFLDTTLTQPTMERFASKMVLAAAMTDSYRTVEAVLGWALGKPENFVTTTVVAGIDLDDPLEIAEGLRFEKLPYDEQAIRHMIRDWPHVNSVYLMGKTILRADHIVRSMFYRLNDGKESIIDRLRINPAGIHMSPAAQPYNDLRPLFDVMSLICNTCVQVEYRWNEYSDVVFYLIGHEGHVRPSDLFLPRTQGLPPKLTRDLFDQSLDTLVQRRGRTDLDVAIARWRNSLVAPDSANRIIDLRTVLESLYATGTGEYRFRVPLIGALYLAPTKAERQSYYAKLRALYDLASELVHGSAGGGSSGKKRKKLDLSDFDEDPVTGRPRDDLVSWSQDYCRRAILKRIGESPDSPKHVWTLNLALGV